MDDCERDLARISLHMVFVKTHSGLWVCQCPFALFYVSRLRLNGVHVAHTRYR